MTDFYNMKIDGLDESSWSTRIGTPQLTGYDANAVPTQITDNVVELPECPIDVNGVVVSYVEKKNGRTIKDLPKELTAVLKEDKLYGKSTLTSHRMLKPHIATKVNSGEMTMAKAEENINNFFFWKTVYKGVRWERFTQICEKWGITLEKIE